MPRRSWKMRLLCRRSRTYIVYLYFVFKVMMFTRLYLLYYFWILLGVCTGTGTEEAGSLISDKNELPVTGVTLGSSDGNRTLIIEPLRCYGMSSLHKCCCYSLNNGVNNFTPVSEINNGTTTDDVKCCSTYLISLRSFNLNILFHKIDLLCLCVFYWPIYLIK